MSWARINQKGTNPMVFLPRIARSLHHPALAVVLGVVLVAIAIFGLTSGDIPRIWAILILVVGALNVLRAVPHPDRQSSDPAENIRTSSAA
jgi:hypothetical protein